ncbi:hypothetical protein VIGAN_11077900 [Vigna angularis var. angularis]|uniref:F-box domain-containing protein n=1 Tax=Vigna angularis var. angularis TaxID=157739 RepID=A0A0S3T922_PHAAN|nr:hypothetical protein VIGAN_11077900 [Vigna angularis var. angularis]
MARVFGRKMATWISWTGIIPDDLVLEILLWLPTTSLMRFRCVYKTWNFLIFNPYFVKLHLEKMLLIWRRRIEGSSFLVSFCSIPCLIQNPAPYFHNNSRRYHFPFII